MTPQQMTEAMGQWFKPFDLRVEVTPAGPAIGDDYTQYRVEVRGEAEVNGKRLPMGFAGNYSGYRFTFASGREEIAREVLRTLLDTQLRQIEDTFK